MVLAATFILLFLAMFLIIVSCLVSQYNVKGDDFSPNQPDAIIKNVLTS